MAAALGRGRGPPDGGDEDEPPDVPSPRRWARGALRLYPASRRTSVAVAVGGRRPQPLVFAASRRRRRTDRRARQIRAGCSASTRHGGPQLFAPPQAQVTASPTGERRSAAAATANPVALMMVRPAAPRRDLTSMLPRRERSARFGTRADGDRRRDGVHAQRQQRRRTRRGQRRDGAAAADGGGCVQRPPRATCSGRSMVRRKRASTNSIAWREENMAPRVDDSGVAPSGAGASATANWGPRSESVVRRRCRADRSGRIFGLASSNESPSASCQGARPAHIAAVARHRPLTYDALRYRIEVKREDGGRVGRDR